MWTRNRPKYLTNPILNSVFDPVWIGVCIVAVCIIGSIYCLVRCDPVDFESELAVTQMFLSEILAWRLTTDTDKPNSKPADPPTDTKPSEERQATNGSHRNREDSTGY